MFRLQIWTESHTKFATALQWGLAVLFAIPSLFFDYQWIDINYPIGFSNQTLYVGLTDIKMYTRYLFILALTNFGRVFMSGICYSLILWKACSYNRFSRRMSLLGARAVADRRQTDMTTIKNDFEMTWAFIAISFLDFMRVVWYVVEWSIPVKTNVARAVITLFYVSTLHEFYSYSKPYIFIVCVPTVRAKFLDLISYKRADEQDMIRRHSLTVATTSVNAVGRNGATSATTGTTNISWVDSQINLNASTSTVLPPLRTSRGQIAELPHQLSV